MAGLFREKNLVRIAHPDHLDEYIRVLRPGSWIVLGVIGLLLAAGAVWSIFGVVTETTPGLLIVNDDSIECYVEQSAASKLQSGDKIAFDDATGIITTKAGAPQQIASLAAETGESVDELRFALGATDWICAAQAFIDLPDGSYRATVTLATYTPFTLVFGAARSS